MLAASSSRNADAPHPSSPRPSEVCSCAQPADLPPFALVLVEHCTCHAKFIIAVAFQPTSVWTAEFVEEAWRGGSAAWATDGHSRSINARWRASLIDVSYGHHARSPNARRHIHAVKVPACLFRSLQCITFQPGQQFWPTCDSRMLCIACMKSYHRVSTQRVRAR